MNKASVFFAAFAATAAATVAAATGTITPSTTLRARNCGPMNRCETQVIDGVLYAKPANAGFTIIIR